MSWPLDMFSKKMKYKAKEAGFYYSPRFKKTISWSAGYESDGATYAPDLSWLAFFAHDRACERGTWDDGTEITNKEASQMYSDILGEKGKENPYKIGPFKYERYKVRKKFRKYMTYWFGGKKLKKQDKDRKEREK